MENTHLEYLSWDSSHFNFKIGSAAYASSETDLNEIIYKARKDGYELIYLIENVTEYMNFSFLQLIPNKLVDRKVIFHHDLNEVNFTIDNYITLSDSTVPTSSIIELAIQSGEFSRFNTDPMLSTDSFKSMYLKWINKSYIKENSDFNFEYVKGGRQLGFTTLQIDKSSRESTIGLIAVNKDTRGQGIGSKLLNAALLKSKELGMKCLKVATQEQNVNACKFYVKNNCKIFSKTNIYHLWLNQNKINQIK